MPFGAILLPNGIYFISCSSESKSTVAKNSPNVISNPSQNFLIVTIETSRREESIML